MPAQKLSLTDFRNYKQLKLTLPAGLSIFIGENAQGKTNILEAIRYASLGRSHRTSKEEELINKDSENARVLLYFERHGVKEELEFILLRHARRRITWNKNFIAPRKIVGLFPTVLFSPEDLYLVKGAPALRRRFLDAGLCQASMAYCEDLARFNQTLKERNALLKKINKREAKKSYLEPWDIQLATLSARLVNRRVQAVEKLKTLAQMMQRRFAKQEELNLSYEITCNRNDLATLPDLTSDKTFNNLYEWYIFQLTKYREADITRGSTSVGPHHDDLMMKVNDLDLRSYGSQGQQRTGALALKLSELEFLRQMSGFYPALLLDDVMSELDIYRREELLSFLQTEKIQTVITATDAAYFPKQNFGTYFKVQAGQVSPL